MSDQTTFVCDKCKAQKQIGTEAPIPQCCSRNMTVQPLDQCTTPASAEHSRFDDAGEPCDDGRAG